jgi:predicted Rossmann-fold nucleotide-binding protein
VMKEIRTASFYERLVWLVDRADGYIAMHGGIGTLAEVTFAWQEVLLGMVPARPLILVGERWRRSFQGFRANLIGGRAMYQPVVIVATPEQALKRLVTHFPQLSSLPQSA